MRVAALYDIHGNLPALEAVLEAVQDEKVDSIVVGGDVLPGPMAPDCLEMLFHLSLPLRFIQGNGERDVLAVSKGRTPTRIPAQFLDLIRWQASRMTPQNLEAMSGWPLTCQDELQGMGKVLFCHATPRDDNEIFTRVTPEEKLRPIFEKTGASLVICGHTHMQFDRCIGGVQVINAGSVGMPFGDPAAYWALLRPEGVQLRSSHYDLDTADRRIRASGYPGEFQVKRPPSESAMLEQFEAAALG